MNRSDRTRRRCREVGRRQRRIKYRLREREFEDRPKPVMHAGKVVYEMAQRERGLGVAGIGVMHRMAVKVGLVDAINRKMVVLKRHLPYWESDHVLAIAYNILAGGSCLEDLELRRTDEVFMDALGAERIPDPTTAGDFCRRCDTSANESLMEAINETRLMVWARQPDGFLDEAIIDADGSIAPTTGQCKEGMDLSYKGEWGYHPLVISLANTGEPLYLVNRSGNRPSHEGAAERLTQAVQLCRKAGFRQVLLRGDTDFSQSRHLDGWDDDGVGFLFGFDAVPVLKRRAHELPSEAWAELTRPAKYEVQTEPRSRPENVRDRIVRERGFETIRLRSESVADFEYSPIACAKTYRMIVVRKNLSIARGERALLDDIRYFFYLTNDWDTPAAELVLLANARCNQENLIEQLKNGVRALKMPTASLESNWAHMIMASLAWTLKAWFALLLPTGGRWATKHAAEKDRVLRMEFKTFLNTMIRIPCQLVHAGRRIIFRLLAWNPWLHVFLRGVNAIG